MTTYTNALQKAMAHNPNDISNPLPGQVKNADGGYMFKVSPKELLERFLILGTSSGSYYASSKKMTEDMIEGLKPTILKEPIEVLKTVKHCIINKRAPKLSPAFFILAYMLGHHDTEIRRGALLIGLQACKTGSHLLEFTSYIKGMYPFSRMVKKNVVEWYTKKPIGDVLFQCTKYANRHGMTHKDLLRLCRPKPRTAKEEAMFGYILEQQHDITLIPDQFKFYDALKETGAGASGLALARIAIESYNAPREWFSTELLKEDELWECLLENNMPIMALSRNLGNLAGRGLLFEPMVMKGVIDRIDEEAPSLHPWQNFLARMTYGEGSGHMSDKTWPVYPELVTVLGNAMVKSFDQFQGTGKKILIAVDLSGSMKGNHMQDSGISALKAAAAMAFILAKTEPNARVVGFEGDRQYDLSKVIKEGKNLSGFIASCSSVRGYYTDASRVLQRLCNSNEDFDTIVFLTDNEFNSGLQLDPLLATYRDDVGHPVKLASIGFTATETTAANSDDPDQLTLVGFDTGAFKVLQDFMSN